MPTRRSGARPPRPRTGPGAGHPSVALGQIIPRVTPADVAPVRLTGREESGKRSLLTVPAQSRDRLGLLNHKELTMQVTNKVNGVDVDRLFGTIDHIGADPTLARFQFRARNQWLDGGHNRTEIKGFYGAGRADTSRTKPFVVDADEPPVLLGENRAPNAPEYLLHALAACLTGTIVYHAAARGIVLDGLEC